MDFFWKPSICLLLTLFVIEVELAEDSPPQKIWPPNQQYIMGYHLFINAGFSLCRDIVSNRIQRQNWNAVKQLAPEHKDQAWINYMLGRCDAAIEEVNKTLEELVAQAKVWTNNAQRRMADKNAKHNDYGHLKDIADIFGPDGRCPLHEDNTV